MEAIGLGQVDDRGVSVHGLCDLLEHAREERLDVARVQRVENDPQGACQALVCPAEVLEVPLALMRLETFALGWKRDHHVRLACRLHAVAADPQAHGLPHQRGHGHNCRRSVDGKRQRICREGRLWVKAPRRRKERTHVGTDKAFGLPVRQERRCLIVDEKDLPCSVKSHHSL